MKLALHTPDSLRQRAAMRLTFGAMITSAILAPLILCTVWLGFDAMQDPVDEGGGPVGITVDLLVATMLQMIPAACFGGLAMHRGATLGSEASAVGWALIGGVLFFGASMLCAALASLDGLPDFGFMLIAMGVVFLFTVIGAIVSAPMGIAFGVLFLIALHPLTLRLDAPFIDTPASAMRTSALMLLVATGVATLFAAAIHMPVATFAHNHLALDCTWLAVVVVPAPLALSSLIFLVIGLLETHALHRQRSAILNGTHPEYLPGHIRPEEDATPLTERDRESGRKHLLVMRTPTAYRGGEARMPAVYVGVTQ